MYSGDYVYPSIYFAYFLFLIFLVGAIYFFLKSYRDGYWGEEGESIKYQVWADEEEPRQNDRVTR